MPWVNPSTVIAGQVLNATKWNQDVVSNSEFLAKPPSCRVQKSTEQAMVTGGWRAISWDVESWDTDTMWSSTARTKIDINTAGKYLIQINASFGVSTSGAYRAVGINVDGATGATPAHGVMATSPLLGGNYSGQLHTGTILSFTSTQFIRVMVFHNHSTNLNLVHDVGGHVPACSVMWVSS